MNKKKIHHKFAVVNVRDRQLCSFLHLVPAGEFLFYICVLFIFFYFFCLALFIYFFKKGDSSFHDRLLLGTRKLFSFFKLRARGPVYGLTQLFKNVKIKETRCAITSETVLPPFCGFRQVTKKSQVWHGRRLYRRVCDINSSDVIAIRQLYNLPWSSQVHTKKGIPRQF
jgi:hypothetical protein